MLHNFIIIHSSLCLFALFPLVSNENETFRMFQASICNSWGSLSQFVYLRSVCVGFNQLCIKT